MPEMSENTVWTGEEHLLALLLCVMQEACSAMSGQLDSWQRSAYARALVELDSCGLVKIVSKADRLVVAEVTPEGRAFLKRLGDEEAN